MSNLLPPNFCSLNVNLRKFPLTTWAEQPESLESVVVSSVLVIRNVTICPCCLFFFFFLDQEIIFWHILQNFLNWLMFPSTYQKTLLANLKGHNWKSIRAWPCHWPTEAMGKWMQFPTAELCAKYHLWCWSQWGLTTVSFRCVTGLVSWVFLPVTKGSDFVLSGNKTCRGGKLVKN